jgi:membrane-associated phospholipid phosphatase
VAWGFLYFGLHNKTDFYRMCAFLYTGMTIFLIISTIYPNGHYLRPYVFERDNIFTRLCAFLYSTDTSTNLFPSIHVYNSVGVHLAVARSEQFRENKKARTASFVLMLSIILSTMFIKQHSTFDVMTALLLCAVMYRIVYVSDAFRISQRNSKSTGRYRRGLPQS